MPAYAQTNLELYDQLLRADYPPEGLALIRDAYGLATRLFSGQIRPSSKPFLDHLVGTASILASVGSAPELVAAGVLHAAYEQGDFGRYRLAAARRAEVRAAVGARVEGYVARYAALPWGWEAIQDYHDRLDRLGPAERELVLMRLANALEDYLDLAVLYCSNAEARVRGVRRRQPLLTAMARRLGFPGLATALDRACERTLAARLSPALRNDGGSKRAFRVAPPSYRGGRGPYADLLGWWGTGPRLATEPAPEPATEGREPDAAAAPPARGETRPPAQTILQLYAQLQRAGYASRDLSLIRAAYGLMVVHTPWRFNPSGKSFLAHCIGAASVLASLRLPAPVVAAGVAHNVYFWGDFGDDERRGPDPVKQAAVRAAVGGAVEGYLARLPALRRALLSPRALRERGEAGVLSAAEALGDADRRTLLIHLADHVDHLNNVRYLSASSERKRRARAEAPLLIALAERLGYPALAAMLSAAADAAATDEVPALLQRGGSQSFLVVPRSSRKRLRVAAAQWVRRRLPARRRRQPRKSARP